AGPVPWALLYPRALRSPGKTHADLLQPGLVANQDVHALRIEQAAALCEQVGERLLDGPGLLVWPARNQCVEDVGHRHDPGFQRDVLALEPIRIAATAVAFVMAQGDGRPGLDEAVVAAAEQLMADPGVAAHDRRLVIR